MRSHWMATVLSMLNTANAEWISGSEHRAYTRALLIASKVPFMILAVRLPITVLFLKTWSVGSLWYIRIKLRWRSEMYRAIILSTKKLGQLGITAAWEQTMKTRDYLSLVCARLRDKNSSTLCSCKRLTTRKASLLSNLILVTGSVYFDGRPVISQYFLGGNVLGGASMFTYVAVFGDTMS